MISEQDLAKLSYPDAPQIITGDIPGPKTRKALEDSARFESMARGAGRFPLVIEEGMGSPVKDPSSNICITAWVAVNSAGHSHPRVIKTIQEQLRKLMQAGLTPLPPTYTWRTRHALAS
jgi:4-aminobutyrate aminotransferase